MFKVSNKNIRTTSMTSFWCFIVNIEHISHFFCCWLCTSKWAGKSLQLNDIFKNGNKEPKWFPSGSHRFFSKNEHFQTCIVISIIFYCRHSGPAQESMISLIGSFGEKIKIFDYNFTFSIKSTVFWEKSQNFAWIYKEGGQDSSITVAKF